MRLCTGQPQTSLFRREAERQTARRDHLSGRQRQSLDSKTEESEKDIAVSPESLRQRHPGHSRARGLGREREREDSYIAARTV